MVYLNVTTSPVDALQTVNDLTYALGIPLLGTSILVFVWLIVFFQLKVKEGAYSASAISSWFSFIIGVFLRFLGLIEDVQLMFMLGVSILTLVLVVYKRNT